MKKKRFLLIVGIFIIVILAILGWFKYTASSNQEQVIQDQPTPTSIRHDNSGVGASVQEDSSGENHMQRIMQHLGL